MNMPLTDSVVLRENGFTPSRLLLLTDKRVITKIVNQNRDILYFSF